MAQRRIMHYKIKKFITIALGVALMIIVAHKVYCRFFVLAQNQEFVINNNVYSDMQCGQGAPLVYDYVRMIGLVEKSIEVKNAFYQQFFHDVHGADEMDHRLVGRKEVKDLLADLYREKVRLVKFDRQMRVCFKGDVPHKKKRTVRHYQKIIEKCIKDLEQILRQL